MKRKRDILVIDLEATCDNAGAVPRDEMEIIEIGAVLVDGGTFEPQGEFGRFVRPVRHPRLTDFCTALTTITQADVDGADTFPAVLEALRMFMAPGGSRQVPLFASWGGYDKNQFRQDAAFHQVGLPFGARHLNIKRAFSDALGTKQRFGMGQALRRVGLPLIGTHHRGIDDARNIARLLPYALRVRPVPAGPSPRARTDRG